MGKRRRKITSLKEVRTDEVSLVESGANLKGRFPLMKSAKGNTMEEILVNVLKAEGRSEAVAKLEEMMDKEDLPEDAKTAVMAAMKLLESFSDMVPVGDALRALRSASGEAEETTEDEVEAGYEEKAEHEDEAEKMKEDEAEKAEHEDEMDKDEDEELKKSLAALPVEAKSVVTNLWKSNRELRNQLGDEIAKRERRDYVAKAKGKLCNIPGHTVDQIVDIVLEAKSRNADLGAKVEKALEAASNGMKGGALLVEVGTSAAESELANGDPMHRVEALAKSLRKDDPSMTIQKAIAKVLIENPKLHREYDAYRAANSKGV